MVIERVRQVHAYYIVQAESKMLLPLLVGLYGGVEITDIGWW